MEGEVKRRWRPYTSAGSGGRPGRSPVVEKLAEIAKLDPRDASSINAEQKLVSAQGLRRRTVRHLRGEIYEIRVSGRRGEYRLLFAADGRRRQILLSLHLFEKKTMATPRKLIDLAEDRLADWRRRGRSQRRE